MAHSNRTHGIAAAMLLAGQASADITQAEWNSDTDFTFAVSYMPDLDQKRNGLICNGNMFCVPTATMNLFSYAAEWGFEDLDPGPGVWQGALGYDLMSLWIAVLGEAMNTSVGDDPCKDGTGGTSWLNATEDWIEDFPLNRARIGKFLNGADTFCPTLSTVAQIAAEEGAVLNICYGRYNVNPGSLVLGSRTGGHCVTVTYAHADGPGVLELYVRDPGDDDNLNSQSPWAYNIYDIETKVVQQDWDENSSYHPISVTVINYDDEAEQIRVIDSVHVLYPWSNYSWSTVELNIGPFAGDFGVATPTYEFEPPAGFEIADVAKGFPHLTYYALVAQGPIAEVMAINPRTGEEGTIAVLSNATDILVGRRGELFVLTGAELFQMDGKGQVEHVYPLPGVYQTMALRDATDELVLINSTQQRMLVMDVLGGHILFDGVIPMPPSASPTIAVRESDGAVALLAPELDTQIFGIRLDVQPQIDTFELPAGLRATDVAFDDHEHLVVATDNGKVADFELGRASWWDWQKAVDSLYADAKSMGAYRVSMSRTNYDPVTNAIDDIQTPADELDYHGTIVVECPADMNADGVLNILDFVKFQDLWTDKDFLGDCNGDDGFNVLDFVCYQELFKKGCP